MSPYEKELDIFELELAIKWAHAAARMDANPEVSYLFALGETALREKLERMNSASPPNDPLTIEQLREMDGEPVWIAPKVNPGRWDLIRRTTPSGMLTYTLGFLAWRDLGRTWLPYRRCK